MNPLLALPILTLDLMRRLLREGIVLRSLVFPVALTTLAMMGTVLALVMLRPPGTLALTPGASTASLVAAAEAEGMPVVTTDDPAAWVRDGRALAATDGETIWLYKAGTEAVRMDGLVREHLPGARWRPAARPGRAQRERSDRGARHLLQFMGALFAFYGVVFGAGSVARDRDAGTLEAELATALPIWVHGAARWLAGSSLLAVFYGFSVLLFDAFLGVPDPTHLILHGAAAAGGSTAIGLVVIGRHGLDSGFAGPMSAGLVVVVSLLSVGLSMKSVGQHLPVASLLAVHQPGPSVVGMSVLWGGVAVLAFVYRSARA